MYLEVTGDEKIDKNLKILGNFIDGLLDDKRKMEGHIRGLRVEIGNLERDLNTLEIRLSRKQ